MSELAQLITSIATLIAAVSSIIVSLRNARKIDAVHAATNGITNRLVQSTADASRAVGNLEGRAELLVEQNGKH